jgi:hypothetical protein
MFQDEARFGRISDTRRCWAPPGVRPNVPHQIVREYDYAFAAVSPLDGLMTSLIFPYSNAITMSLFLQEVSFCFPDEFILMFMDQAGWHKAEDLIIPKNMRLKWLPPYSPQCNPVEHLWDEIREKWFANEVFKSMEAVEARLVEALCALEEDPSRVQYLTGFPWIVNL